MKNPKYNISILFVEDQKETRIGISEMLKRRFSTVFVAENGKDALEIYKKHKPDLVLSDVQMPFMDGLQLAEKIKEINPNAKVIMMTAFTDSTFLLKAIELQVEDYLVKPIRKHKLLSIIKKHVENIQLEKELIAKDIALIKSEEKYRLLTESLNDVLLQISVEGEILYISPAIKKFSGYSDTEEIGNFIRKYFVDIDEFNQAIHIISDSKTAKNGGIFEFQFRAANNNIFPVEVSYIPLFDGGKVIALQLVMRNTTERKEAEKSRIQYTKDLQERNEDLDAFSQTVAHDLNNPIASIIGFTELLLEDYNHLSEKEIKKLLRIVVDSGEKMKQIISSLLLFASLRKADVITQELSMCEILANSISRFKSIIDKNNVKFLFPKKFPKTVGNSQWVEEVLVNYISNAIKYGGIPPVIEIRAEIEDNNMVRFFVRDNGNGISKEDQKLLFKQFERLNQVGISGHGLGLSIVRRIVEKLGGEVGVNSEIGKGSEFYFSLPLSINSENIDSKEPVFEHLEVPKVEHNIKRKLNIIIAEDEEVSNNLLSIIVKDISSKIISVKTGADAVESCRYNPDVDLILMDINMPIMNGYDATREIRTFNKSVKIIAQTAYDSNADREKAIDVGCDNFIAKPIAKVPLLEMIENLFVK